MKCAVIAPVGRSLVQRHDIGEWHAPQIVEFHQHAFERFREVAYLRFGERRQARMRPLRRDKDLVGVTREIRQKGDGRFVLGNDAPPVLAFGLQDILKENPSCLCQMALRNARFGLDCLEDEIGSVNLAMRVRVGYANHLAFVFENQDVADLVAAAQFDVLLLPDGEQVCNVASVELGEGDIVFRAVTHDARDAGCGAVAVNPLDRRQFLGRVETHARVIVVEYERARVLGVSLAADARVSGAEVAVRKMRGQYRWFMLDSLAAPRAILAVRGNNNPFLTQRVPSFFPDHSLQSKEQNANDKATTCLAQISLIQAYCVRVYYRTTSQVFSRRLPAFRHV